MWLAPVTLPPLSTGACDQTAYRPPALSMASTAKSWPVVTSPEHPEPSVGAKTRDLLQVAPPSVERLTTTALVELVQVVSAKAVWMAKTSPLDWLTMMLPAMPSLQSMAL